MKPQRLWAIFKKELIHIRRDPRSLMLLIFLPILMLVMFGYALTFDIKDVPVAVYNQDRGHLSQAFIDEFRGSRYFSVRYWVSGYDELDRLLTTKQVRLALVVPPEFSRALTKGDSIKVQTLVDGTEPQTANIVLGYCQLLCAAYNQRLGVEDLRRQGVTRAGLPVRSEVRFWFNAPLESINFIVPGLIVVIMTIVGTLLTALTVVREVEQGTMESLSATTLKKSELILGKLGPYFLIGMLDMAVVMAMGHFHFGVPLRGQALLLIALGAVFLVAMLGQGLLISATSENQLQAFQIAMLITFLPAALLSGFVFAIPLMPWPLQLVTFLVPARYLVSIAKGIYLKGVGLEVLWPDALMLLAFAACFLLAAMGRVAKKSR